MKFTEYAGLVFSALCEFTRYEVISALRGPANLDRRLGREPISAKSNSHELVRTICDAVLLAASLYWKPVLCLQRSVCTVRLLRKRGVMARLVIGYRTAPFFSHAWVEVGGRIVNDSPGYQERLQVLYAA